MRIVDVESELRNNVATQPLKLVSLAALNPSRELFLTMVLQPQGRIEANTNRVGNVDQAAAALMGGSFLELSIQRQVDLVVGPEYCFPWAVIDKMISGNLRPRVGAIWALGCESITPADLRRRSVGLPADVRLIHEDLDARQESQKHFIDPLVYVFWTIDASGNQVLCILVQFKTEPCKDHIEVSALFR